MAVAGERKMTACAILVFFFNHAPMDTFTTSVYASV